MLAPPLDAETVYCHPDLQQSSALAVVTYVESPAAARSRYYSDAKTYSGEAEDDANEALRRLARVLDERPSKQLRSHGRRHAARYTMLQALQSRPKLSHVQVDFVLEEGNHKKCGAAVPAPELDMVRDEFSP